MRQKLLQGVEGGVFLVKKVFKNVEEIDAMDRIKTSEKLKTWKAGLGKRSFLAGLAGFLIVGGLAFVLGIYPRLHPHHDNHEKQPSQANHARSHAGSPSVSWELYQLLKNTLYSIRNKADTLAHALEENHRLRLENSNLRLWGEALRFDCAAGDASKATRSLSLKLSEETGAAVGRTLASIRYSPPAHLLPAQLYTLGVSYFKGREYEKAAVIFTFLTGLDDDASFKTARNFLLTGVAWYRVDHFKLADLYFKQSLNTPRQQENLSYHAQARLWKAITAERLDQHANSQEWLRLLVDHHPQSVEAGWVNDPRTVRFPASTVESGHETPGESVKPEMKPEVTEDVELTHEEHDE